MNINDFREYIDETILERGYGYYSVGNVNEDYDYNENEYIFDVEGSEDYKVVNYRYFNKLPVIVSCELDIDGVLNIDEAIGSRLVEMCKMVEVKGKKLNYGMSENYFLVNGN